MPITSSSLLKRYKLNYPRNAIIILALYYRLAVLFSPKISYMDLKYAYQRVSW